MFMSVYWPTVNCRFRDSHSVEAKVISKAGLCWAGGGVKQRITTGYNQEQNKSFDDLTNFFN